MMMIQIEYPALAPRAFPSPTTADRFACRLRSLACTQHNTTERSLPLPYLRPTDSDVATSLPPSLSDRFGQSALRRQRRAPPLRRHHRRRPSPQRRPARRGDRSLLRRAAAAAAAKWKPKMVSIPTVSQSALVSSAEGKCLACHHSTSTQAVLGPIVGTLKREVAEIGHNTQENRI